MISRSRCAARSEGAASHNEAAAPPHATNIMFNALLAEHQKKQALQREENGACACTRVRARGHPLLLQGHARESARTRSREAQVSLRDGPVRSPGGAARTQSAHARMRWELSPS